MKDFMKIDMHKRMCICAQCSWVNRQSIARSDKSTLICVIAARLQPDTMHCRVNTETTWDAAVKQGLGKDEGGRTRCRYEKNGTNVIGDR